jgi:hypothetical protein
LMLKSVLVSGLVKQILSSIFFQNDNYLIRFWICVTAVAWIISKVFPFSNFYYFLNKVQYKISQPLLSWVRGTTYIRKKVCVVLKQIKILILFSIFCFRFYFRDVIRRRRIEYDGAVVRGWTLSVRWLVCTLSWKRWRIPL